MMHKVFFIIQVKIIVIYTSFYFQRLGEKFSTPKAVFFLDTSKLYANTWGINKRKFVQNFRTFQTSAAVYKEKQMVI